MNEQAAEPGEGFVALVAAVGPLARVRVHVVAQQIRQAEALVAQLALVGFVSVVRQHVVLQLGFVAVAFAAVSAAERLLLVQPLVRSHVLQKGEVLPAVGTFIRLLARVDDEVLLQVAAEPEALAAHFALVRLVLGMNAHVQLQHGAVAECLSTLGTLVRLGAVAFPLLLDSIAAQLLLRRRRQRLWRLNDRLMDAKTMKL